MTEFVTVVVGAMLVAGCTYAGFLVGRERSEAVCHNTIANLRRANAGLRARVERLQEANTRMANALGDARPRDPDAPRWMK